MAVAPRCCRRRRYVGLALNCTTARNSSSFLATRILNSAFRPPPARELLDEARVEAAAAATRAVVAAALVAVLVGRVAARDPSLVVQRGDERDYARGGRGPSAAHSKRSSSLCTHYRPNSSAGPSTAGSRRTKRAVKKHYRVGRRARPRSGVSRYARRGSRRRGRAACPSGSRTAALPTGGGRTPRRAAAAPARGSPVNPDTGGGALQKRPFARRRTAERQSIGAPCKVSPNASHRNR